MGKIINFIMEQNLFIIFFSFLAIFGVILVIPFLVFWSLKVLGIINITYNVKTFIAYYIIIFLLLGSLKIEKVR